MKVLKFYILIMTICWKKVGILFKGGHYIREDIIQGNTVYENLGKAAASPAQGSRKVRKSGGARSTVVGIICPPG